LFKQEQRSTSIEFLDWKGLMPWELEIISSSGEEDNDSSSSGEEESDDEKEEVGEKKEPMI
jgi:hypothetical protein